MNADIMNDDADGPSRIPAAEADTSGNLAVDGLGFAVAPDPQLVAAGWVPRYLADPERAKEAEELYGSLGHEVMARKLEPGDFGARCQGCAAEACKSYVMIYTRKRAGVAAEAPSV